MALDHSKTKEWVGKESGTIAALDTVSKSDIRHWCELVDEDTTQFHEIDFKRKSAPPAMMIVWTNPPLWSPGPKKPMEPHELILNALDEAGYDGMIGLALDQEFLKCVYVGDQLSYKVKVVALSSDEVDTNMGKGYLLELGYTLWNQRREKVSTHKYTLLKFRTLKPTSRKN